MGGWVAVILGAKRMEENETAAPPFTMDLREGRTQEQSGWWWEAESHREKDKLV